jgi:hypothetical protein
MVTRLQFLSRLYCDGEEASQHRQVSQSVDSVITRVLKHILLCNRRHHFQSSVSCDTLDSLEAYMIFCHRGSWSGSLSFFWLWIICMQIVFFTGILRQAYTHRFSVFLKPLINSSFCFPACWSGDFCAGYGSLCTPCACIVTMTYCFVHSAQTSS